MPIELPGFESIFDNAVYGRNREGDPLVTVLRVQRYAEPTKAVVLEYLQKKASSVSTTVSLLNPDMPAPTEGKSSLEIAMMTVLAPRLLLDLGVKLQSATDYVNKFISVKEFPEEVAVPVYCRATYGVLPLNLISANMEKGLVVDSGWYDLALGNAQLRAQGLGEKWNVRLWLNGGSLPARTDINTLLGYNVAVAPLFKVSPEDYPQSEVREVLDSLYSGLGTTEAVGLIEDTSATVLEASALRTVLNIYEVQTKMAEAQRAQEARTRGPLGAAGIPELGRRNG